MRTLLLFTMLLLCGSLSAQIGINEDFESGFPSSWSNAGSSSSTFGACDGTSIRDNIYSGSATGSVTTNTATNATTDEVTISFDYKIVDYYSTSSAADSDFGQVELLYSTDGSTFSSIWTTTTPVGTCTNQVVTIPANTLTAGDDVTFRFEYTWNADDWYIYLDNFSATQPGACVEATATYTVAEDCANGQFSIDVAVTDPGSATTLTIADDQGSATQAANLSGVNTFGPYASETDVVFTITNDQNGSCSTTSPTQSFICPPPNDLCSGAEALTVTTDGTCSAPLTTTNLSSTASGTTPTPTCGSFGAGQDVWYTAIVPASGDLTIEVGTAGGPTDMVMQAYSGTCGALIAIECDDDGGSSFTPFLELTGRTPGETITLRLFESGNNSFGDFTICAYSLNCASPTATYAISEDCANDQFYVEIVISDVGTATTLTIADDQGSPTQTASMTDTYTFGPYASGTSVVFTTTNDQDGACFITSPTQSFTCPPPNNECSTAQALFCGGTPIDGSTVSATDNADGIGCDMGPAVWYTFSGNGFDVTLTADPESGYDIELGVYSGDCAGTLTSEECVDSGGSGTAEDYTFTTVSGVTYYASVGHYSNTSTQTGDFTIGIECGTCAPPEATATVATSCNLSGEYEVTLDISSLGSATSLSVSDGTPPTTITNTGEITYSYPPGSGTITFTLTNDQDGTCEITRTATIPAACPPPNDACAGAIALTDISGAPTAASGDTYDSSDATQSASVDYCTGNDNDDLWFTVTVPNGAGDVITITTGGTTDMVIGLYSGDCENLVGLKCVDEHASGVDAPETLVYTVPAARGGAAAPQTYFVQVYDYFASGGEFTVSASTALPVDLISFNGQAMEKANKLTWSTAREEAADRYVVERSSNANNDWAAIGEVLAAGDSETELFYELMDESPLANAYYRLRMVDLDGTFTFSNIVELTNNTLGDTGLSVFPVPALSEVTVGFEAQAAGKAMIVLTDLTGRTISEQEVNVAAGYNAETVNLQPRASGVFLVRVSVDGRQMVHRLIKR
ncbi:T9SS type A sorting domain-containing protein [Neolewinella aurantiaca]|uniref:T9SS type A sorting domain-containing protein n=1 Tax=Neolewinella aurantiaca TaxID=2602767 RepID=A0A5C7FC66_9BACT|nr:T9SS type A sorting domain-containing protein [Neolewinella aurantiaca]TXF88506.1 T9SS type A sorting domain-containing protein [Neolewinella aurantiaca]